MVMLYASLGLIVVGIIDGLNALRSSSEDAARSWAIAMVLLPWFAGAIVSLVLFGAATVVGADLSLSIVRLVLIPEGFLLLYLAWTWRRSLAGDKDERVTLTRMLVRSSAHPHRVFAIGLIVFLAYLVAGVVPFTLGGSSVPATEDLDPAGLAFQEAVLADDTFTLGEFEDAVAGMASCMEQRGIDVGRWTVTLDEGWSFSYSSHDDIDAEAVHDICYYSYVHDVSDAAGS